MTGPHNLIRGNKMSSIPAPMPAPGRFGFHDTMKQHAEAASQLAISAIAAATDEPVTAVCAFLDSRHGRYFADEVQNELHAGHALQDAIYAVTTRWMQWAFEHQGRTDEQTLPFLTGLVMQSAQGRLQVA